MTVIARCQHCGGSIEADHETLGSIVDCRYCGQKTVLEARRAPTFGGPAPAGFSPKQLVGRSGKLIIGAVFGVVVFGIVVALSHVGQPSDQDGGAMGPGPSRTVNATILRASDGIIVENDDKVGWDSITVYINDDPPSGFSATISSLAAGQRVAMPYSGFAKDNGERFQPDRVLVKKVWIGGGVYDYKGYGL